MVTPQKDTSDGLAIGPVHRFGRFTMVKKLATGGMAEIWLARQSGFAGFNRFVVIKKILSHLSEQESFISMFVDEARTSALLNHPNVVQIYDLGNHDGAYYISMEFIAGENLAAIAWRGMKRGRPLPPAFAARVIADACKALHYAHHLRAADGSALDIVHRDISPQNVLVTYEGEVKVVDFGIAKAATKSEHTKTGMLKGKFSYMSPEQCLGANVDMRSDIFALGILLYELCTGKRLFKHESELMILDMITKRSVVPPSQVAPQISATLEDVIMRGLEKDPADRFQTAQAMQLALEDYLREEGEQASSTELAAYMRDLFADKIAEKQRLKEIASRDDFENLYGADEESTQAGMERAPGGRRKLVVGAPPSQVRVSPVSAGAAPFGLAPGVHAPTGAAPGARAPLAGPGGQSPQTTGAGPSPHPGTFTGPGGAPPFVHASGGFGPGESTTALPPSQVDDGSVWMARLAVGAVLVICVALAILFHQFRQQQEPAAAPAQVVIAAAPRPTGSLTLESVPEGAAIHIDGKEMSAGDGPATTPSDIHTLQYGTTYRLKLVKEGYKPFETAVTMSQATDKQVLRPELEAFPGTLVAEVRGQERAEVRVFFDEEDVGLGPRVSRTRPGFTDVTVKARLAGSACSADPPRVRIEPNQTRTVSIDCRRETPAPRPERPAPLTAARPTPRPEGRPASEPVPPPKAPPRGAGDCVTDAALPPGYVTISTKPYSEIFWGDKRLGETPLSKHKLPSGCVKLRAVNKQLGKEKEVRVDVEPNKVQIFKFTLE